MNEVNIVFIADGQYVIPTATAIYSIIKNKSDNTSLHIYIVSASIELEQENIFHELESENVKIEIVRVLADKYKSLHSDTTGTPCVATVAALFKFELPELLSQLDKVLYLDGDLIVREDLGDLYSTDIDNYYLAAVVDSGSIYYKHDYVKRVKDYFNSGVMLLNLKKMREDSSTEKLIKAKLDSHDSFLMDQNIFNLVFDKKVYLLPIRYNCLYVNLIRSASKYSIDDINARYFTNFKSLTDLCNDAVIIHYSSKDKPWKYSDVPLGDEWNEYFNELSSKNSRLLTESSIPPYRTLIKRLNKLPPRVSIIIPVYNTGEYLRESLETIINQTLKDIEIICINDGSSDDSLSILSEYSKSDDRIILLSQENAGQSIARNQGIRIAQGKYIYFFDSDDILMEHALEQAYYRCERDHLDLLLFDGETIYENDALNKSFSSYQTAYIRNNEYNDIYLGTDLYVDMVRNRDYKVSPCLQFFRRDYILDKKIFFRENIIYEDNLFSLQALLYAERVAYTPQRLFIRRIRRNSTMTKKNTYKNFNGYFICLTAMSLFILNEEFPDKVIETATRQLLYFYKTMYRSYKSLPTKDKRQPWFSDPKERLFASFLYKTLQAEEDSEKRLNQLKSSYSYRIGRKITYIPRKIRGGILCYKQHGIKYTLNRIKQKTKRLLKRK